jgi:hypothetical protein
MPGSMLILTWVGIIFVKICKIMTNIMPTHVKISIEPSIRELFLKQQLCLIFIQQHIVGNKLIINHLLI